MLECMHEGGITGWRGCWTAEESWVRDRWPAACTASTPGRGRAAARRPARRPGR